MDENTLKTRIKLGLMNFVRIYQNSNIENKNDALMDCEKTYNLFATLKELKTNYNAYENDANYIHEINAIIDAIDCDGLGIDSIPNHFYLKNVCDCVADFISILCENADDLKNADYFIIIYGDRRFTLYDADEYDDNFTVCDICGDRLAFDDAREFDGEYLCDSCYDDNVVVCNNCGYEMWRRDAYYSDYDDEYYCEDCYYERDDDYDDDRNATRNGRINGYHNTNTNYEYRKTSKDGRDALYFGFELETENEDDPSSYLNDYDQPLFIHTCEHDGSLNNGCEFISEPLTYNYYKEHKKDFDDFLSDLKNCGYTSHNNGRCGLHFHFNETRDENNAKIVHFMVKNWTWFTAFSRRTNFEYCHALNLSYTTKSTKTKKQVKDLAKTGYFKNYSHSYFFISNENRTHTSEIRLMRGTLNADTFYATFALINALIIASNKAKITFHAIKKILDKNGDLQVVMNYCNARNITIEGGIK